MIRAVLVVEFTPLLADSGANGGWPPMPPNFAFFCCFLTFGRVNLSLVFYLSRLRLYAALFDNSFGVSDSAFLFLLLIFSEI